MSIPEFITQLTSISNEDVADAPSVDEVIPQIVDFIGGCDIVAHNADFDRRFIEHRTGPLPGRWVDSVVLARVAFPRLRNFKQATLVELFAPEQSEGAHRATNDVAALRAVWRIVLAGLSTLDPHVLHSIALLFEEQNAPEAGWLRLIDEYVHQTSGAKPAKLHLAKYRNSALRADKSSAFWDAYEKELTFPDFQEIVTALSEDGVAGAMYDEFEPRAEQVDMACDINDAFAQSKHFVVEAGTGVGKSLAYLVPAALTALRNQITIGIATKTNALADQLMYKELPLLDKALGGALRYTALKGYDNYFCLRKVDAQLSDLMLAPRDMGYVLAWISETPWGDLDSISYIRHSDAGALLKANALDCSKNKCRYYPGLCYLHGSRQRARSSHIIVTNHSLLFRDTLVDGLILPPVRYWVIDEAHGAESEARNQLEITANSQEFKLMHRQFANRHSGLLDQLKRVAHIAGSSQEEYLATIDKLVAAFETIRNQSSEFFEAVLRLGQGPSDNGYDRSVVWINNELRNTALWSAVWTEGKLLYSHFDNALSLSRTLMGYVNDVDSTLPQVFTEFSGALFRLGALSAALAQVISEPEDNAYYHADLFRGRQRQQASLVMSYIAVGPLIAEQLFGRANSVIFTSATVAAGEDFSSFAQGVGLATLPENRWSSRLLPSSYDLESNMTIYAAVDGPSVQGSEYRKQLADFLIDIHRATNGGVLTLFTNRAEMLDVYKIVAPVLENESIDLLVQQQATPSKALREQFINTKSTSLFATKSFWEGFDAQGDTLRCVVVVKLPFPRPTDPLIKSRELIEPNVWRKYSLPEAIVELKQAVGRLIRSSTDSGCVIIADPRLATARYGTIIQDALPVRPRVMSRADIIADLSEN